MKPSPARLGALATIASLSLLVAACGGSGDLSDAATADTSQNETAADGAQMDVTIEHEYGKTELTAVPQRIASLDPQFTDVLLALGVTPVAFVADARPGFDATYPWQGDQLADSTPIPFDGVAYQNQDVFNADPDLIVGTYAIEDQSRFDALTEIAPTIAAPDPDREVQRWQDMVTLAGQILDREDDAAQLIDDLEAQIAEHADALPGLEGKTYTFVNYMPGTSLTVLADPEDGASEIFATLGLEPNPNALEAADGATGRATFSLEQVKLLDSDLIIMLANGGNPEDLVGWDSLAAVENGAVVQIDWNQAVALNQPTPLSVPWVLDELTPTLEKAES